jgi:hypothetical protein
MRLVADHRNLTCASFNMSHLATASLCPALQDPDPDEHERIRQDHGSYESSSGWRIPRYQPERRVQRELASVLWLR